MKLEKKKRWILITITLLTIVLVFIACTKNQSQTNTVERWEYRVIRVTNDEDTLNQLGNEGWELVTQGIIFGSQQTHHMWFKRKVQ